MFNLGPAEWAVLLLVGLIVFGPERLPKVAADAGRMLRQLRRMADDVRSDLKDEIGADVLGDLDLKSMHPRALVQKHLLSEVGEDFEDLKRTVTAAVRVDPPASVQTPAPSAAVGAQREAPEGESVSFEGPGFGASSLETVPTASAGAVPAALPAAYDSDAT